MNFTITSSTWPIPDYSWTAATSPIAQPPHVHRPETDELCATFERVVDEQLAMYEADLKAPCPKCGHVKTYDDEGNLA